MKKRFISLCLTLALTAAPAGAAFSDISSGSLQQTASILGSLGIMQGTGNNRFEPNRPLTRAEFCKLAVTAMGIDGDTIDSAFRISLSRETTPEEIGLLVKAVREKLLPRA